MLTIGITGGIGSGKSTVAKILAELGAPMIDADKVAHETYLPGGPAYQAVIGAFGSSILASDGTVDRKKLGPIVFADPDGLRRLNAIVWPRTFELMRARVGEIRGRGERRPIVIEAAVLIEAGWQPLCDEIWLVAAPRALVVARIERDRGMMREQIEARIRAQLSDEERRKHATLVIENAGAIEDLRDHVTGLWRAALTRNG